MTEQSKDDHDRPDAKAAWSDAGDRLGGLGARLRQHYEQHAQTPPEHTGAEVKDAAKRLNQAVHSAFEAIASASKDPAVKDDARRAGRSVADALAGTFAGISGELSKTFGGTPKDQSSVGQPDPSAPAYGTPDPTPDPTPASAAPSAPPADAPSADAPSAESMPPDSMPPDSTPPDSSAGTPAGSPPGAPDPGSPESGPPQDQ